jgi:hypothetical protein
MPRMPASLRCVFYDPDAVDVDSHLSARAFEACARAGIDVFALAGGEETVNLEGESHEVTHPDGSIAFVMRALSYTPEQCIGVGSALISSPVSTVWVSPLDLEVRGAKVRVAEEGEELLYQAVIAELAIRRGD